MHHAAVLCRHVPSWSSPATSAVFGVTVSCSFSGCFPLWSPLIPVELYTLFQLLGGLRGCSCFTLVGLRRGSMDDWGSEASAAMADPWDYIMPLPSRTPPLAGTCSVYPVVTGWSGMGEELGNGGIPPYDRVPRYSSVYSLWVLATMSSPLVIPAPSSYG